MVFGQSVPFGQEMAMQNGKKLIYEVVTDSMNCTQVHE
jgi:hypothetical protein